MKQHHFFLEFPFRIDRISLSKRFMDQVRLMVSLSEVGGERNVDH